MNGLVDDPLALSLEDIKTRSRVTMPEMMECGGNGRAQLSPRPVARGGGRVRRMDAPRRGRLCVRATDSSGKTQPLDDKQAWNQGGYGISVVQRVPVRVT